MKDKVLLIVDVQNDFCPLGSLACQDGDRIVEVINELLRDKEWKLVIATQDWHPNDHCSFAVSHENAKPFSFTEDGYPDMVWPVHCVAGTYGAEINPALDQGRISLVIRKGLDRDVDSYSAYKDNNGSNPTVLNDIFAGTTVDMYVCGIATEVCVKNTAIDAIMPYVTVHVISDACAGVTAEGHDAALDEMKNMGIAVVTSEEIP